MTESEELEQQSRPSAFALAIIFGGTVGLTVSKMLGLSGDFGFIVGFFIFFILLLIAILRTRSDDRDELIAQLENEIITLRINIFDNFIAPKTASSDSEINGTAMDKKELSELYDALNRLRESGFLSGKIRPLGKAEAIKTFKSEVESIAKKIQKLQLHEKYKTQLKALEILKLEAEGEISILANKGVEK